jgi:hypothetical protein
VGNGWNGGSGCCVILNNFNARDFVDEIGYFLLELVDNAMFSLDRDVEDDLF